MPPKPPRVVVSALQKLLGSVNELIAAIGTIAHAKAGSASNGRRALSPKARAAKSAKLKRSIKSHWDSMTPRQHAARVRKMLAARGLKPIKKK